MQNNKIGKGMASIGICVLGGGVCMYFTKGSTGIGWAVFGLYIIWG